MLIVLIWNCNHPARLALTPLKAAANSAPFFALRHRADAVNGEVGAAEFRFRIEPDADRGAYPPIDQEPAHQRDHDAERSARELAHECHAADAAQRLGA